MSSFAVAVGSRVVWEENRGDKACIDQVGEALCSRRQPVFASELLALGAVGITGPVYAQGAEPGAFAPDLEAAERALERTLVLRGQLLLPEGQIEVDPSLIYEHTDRDVGYVLALIDTDGDGIANEQTVDAIQRERDRVTALFDFRLGLPRDLQLEVRVPLIYESFSERTAQSLDAFERNEDASGLGDIRIGYAKTLARELGAVPDIIGRIAWDTASGSDNDFVSLTSGYNEVIGSLSAVRRLDPLVLTGGILYQHSFESDGVEPGDLFGFNFGTTLAASPSTALSLGFNASFRSETKLDNVTIDGSDLNEAFITFGISSVIRRNALLSVNFGAGLTDDSPDYFFAASLPFRFNAW